jgi:hypothetical protein
MMEAETIDGVIFGMQLAANPKVTARRLAWLARRSVFAASIKDKTKAEMIAELKSNNPVYIISILESHSEACFRERYIATFMR